MPLRCPQSSAGQLRGTGAEASTKGRLPASSASWQGQSWGHRKWNQDPCALLSGSPPCAKRPAHVRDTGLVLMKQNKITWCPVSVSSPWKGQHKHSLPGKLTNCPLPQDVWPGLGPRPNPEGTLAQAHGRNPSTSRPLA